MPSNSFIYSLLILVYKWLIIYPLFLQIKGTKLIQPIL